MDLPLIKYHIQALYKLLIQEPNSTTFGRLAVDIESWLNSSALKNIKEERLVPITALQIERKRRQAVEKLLNQIQKNPSYPDEVKSDIAKSYQETMRKYHKQIKNLHQTPKQAS